MTDPPSLSVVVASHGRPRALRRCLLALSQSTARLIEGVAVADKAGLDALRGLPCAARVKTVLQAEPNLSRARNDGIAMAAGEVVAFIDDDAVPEPTWAARLAEAFAHEPNLAAATGPVLGRNGISVQWGPMAIDRQGRDRRLRSAEALLPKDTARKLHGTNMAIRRDVLREIGGFDPAFRFYLDDTDMALRLADRGMSAIWLPRAQVHHAFAASERRDADRLPLSLYDVGASTAVFLRKHAPAELDGAIAALADDQRARIFRLVRKRRLGARSVELLTHSLRDGIRDGRARAIGQRGDVSGNAPWSLLHETPPHRDEVLSGWRHEAAAIREKASRLVARGARVSVFLFEPTPRAHTVRFTDGGWWEQTGGLYGRSDRGMPRIQAWRFKSRLFSEIRRISDIRFDQGAAESFLQE